MVFSLSRAYQKAQHGLKDDSTSFIYHPPFRESCLTAAALLSKHYLQHNDLWRDMPHVVQIWLVCRIHSDTIDVGVIWVFFDYACDDRNNGCFIGQRFCTTLIDLTLDQQFNRGSRLKIAPPTPKPLRQDGDSFAFADISDGRRIPLAGLSPCEREQQELPAYQTMQERDAQQG
jgi:hypothetical protein